MVNLIFFLTGGEEMFLDDNSHTDEVLIVDE